MPKKYTKSRRPMRKRKSFRKGKRSGKFARKQQQNALTYVKKRYSRVFTMDIAAADNVFNQTISLIGGKNSVLSASTKTLFDVDQDSQLSADMRLYQFFKITGVAIKQIFPMPTNEFSSPVQWVSAYSANEVLYPAIIPARVQTLATYQTGSCNQNKPISRFYNTAASLKRFGIQYCDTSEYPNFNVPGTALYGGQLKADQGSSMNMKVYRGNVTGATPKSVVGRYQVTYYVMYKGNKGISSLIAP